MIIILLYLLYINDIYACMKIYLNKYKNNYRQNVIKDSNSSTM